MVVTANNGISIAILLKIKVNLTKKSNKVNRGNRLLYTSSTAKLQNDLA